MANQTSAPLGCALMGASGFAALGYQIVWTERCALWLGHESAAILAVVTAFFGGLALGGLLLGDAIERSKSPARWYVGCEISIALWSVALLLLGPTVSGWLAHMTGPSPSPFWQWSVAFGGTFLLFLPATAAMGVTLPAMERLTAELRQNERTVSVLYAANTLGAVLGVLITTFWAIPRLGLARTTLLCAGLNLLCAALCLAFVPEGAAPEPHRRTLERSRAQPLLARMALTGFLGIGYEVLVVRVLSQVTENTVYTFALLLAVYLVGTAGGAAAYRRWFEGPRALGADAWLIGLALSCLLGSASLWVAEDARSALTNTFASGGVSGIAAEVILAVFAFGLPTVAMGALFSELGKAALASGISFGRATGVNLLAAAVAPVFWGVWAIPKLEPKLSLLLIPFGYLLALRPRLWQRPSVILVALLPACFALFAPKLRFGATPEGGRIVSYQEGVMAAVSVIEDAQGVARLHINNREQEGSSGTFYVDARQAWLPLLLHPRPSRALFYGLGTGVTAAAAALDPSLEVDVVELVPEVIAASSHFARSKDDQPARRRLRIVASDARRYAQASPVRYDVIVADNFHPARSGTGALYSVEHFRAIRAQLHADGLFCQWLPLHQLDLRTLRSIVRSFLMAYPQGGAILASHSLETPVVGLISRVPVDYARIRTRLEARGPNHPSQSLGLEDEYALLGSFIAGPLALGHFAGRSPANTDDRPIVAYQAPKSTYSPESEPADKLLELTRLLELEPEEILSSTSDQEWTRLKAYWSARDRYLEAGRSVRLSARLDDMLSQVVAPLTEILQVSADFRPAYDPLLTMAEALTRSDVDRARALLTELVRIQPTRGEAREMLRRLREAP